MADHPLDYTITQKSKYDSIIPASYLIGFLGFLMLIGIVLTIAKKRKALQISLVINAYSSGPPRMNAYGMPAQTAYCVPQYPGYGVPPTPVLENTVVIDYVCGKCGNLIQNPIVQGVITCERCGEKEYIQQ